MTNSWKNGSEQILNTSGRLVLPLVHKRAELTSLRKPHHSMNMIRHDHKTKTESLMLGQTTPQMANDDPLRPITLQEHSTFVTRECHKVDMFFIIVDPSLDHRAPFLGQQSLPKIERGG